MSVENSKNERLKVTGTYRMRPSVIPPLQAVPTAVFLEEVDEDDGEETVKRPPPKVETRKLKRVR